jgi:hypothetical protein
VDSCQTIRNCSGMSERKRRSMMRTVVVWTESNGRHFGYFCSFSFNSQFKYFRTHVDMDILYCTDMRNSCSKFVRIFQ